MEIRFLPVWLLLIPFGRALAAEPAPEGLGEAFRILDGTRTGLSVHERARERVIPVVLGTVSKTDLIATRSGEGSGRRLSTEVRVVVAMNKDPVFQALDLAHELTHATGSRPDPFDPKLDPLVYVRSGIEGVGGEASAIRAECEVGRELLRSPARSRMNPATRLLLRARCGAVWSAVAEPERWIASFYHMGQYYWDFLHTLSGLNLEQGRVSKWRRRIKAKTPLFSSAVTHKPYPLALLEEYVEVTKKVCAGTKRLDGRSPAARDGMEARCDTVGMEQRP